MASKMHHAITPLGLMKAADVARELARKYELHEIAFKPSRPGSSHGGPEAVCTCGWRTHNNARNAGAVKAAAAKHLASVADGTYSAPRPVSAIFAETMQRLSVSQSAARSPSQAPVAAGPESGAAGAHPRPPVAPQTSNEVGHA